MKLLDIYNRMADEYGDKNGEMVFTFSDKGSMHSYIEFYEKYFEPKRDNASLLEIGVMTGGSLHMWQEYFKTYQLVGLDLSPSWNQPRPFQAKIESDPNITLHFSQNSKDSTSVTVLNDQKFDFVIDDGDHSCEAQIATFKNYWAAVANGGTYFIEDVIGPDQIAELKIFLDQYKDIVNIEHYQGFKRGRNDDQILAVTKGTK